ncbi:MAG TPA: hypothetical protein VIY49_37530 [Bryobacteraceae bacterium]
MSTKPHWQQIGLGRANNRGVSNIYGNAPCPPRKPRKRRKRKRSKGRRANKRATQTPWMWVGRAGEPPAGGPNMGRGHFDPERDERAGFGR